MSEPYSAAELRKLNTIIEPFMVRCARLDATADALERLTKHCDEYDAAVTECEQQDAEIERQARLINDLVEALREALPWVEYDSGNVRISRTHAFVERAYALLAAATAERAKDE